MKIILEFNGEEEIKNFQSCLNGYKWKLVVGIIYQLLNDKLRNSVNMSMASRAPLSELKSILEKTLETQGLKINIEDGGVDSK